MLNLKKLLTKILSSFSTIGTSLAGTAQVDSVPSETKTIVNRITLPKGKWLIVYQAALNISAGKQFQATITPAGAYDISAEQIMTGMSGIYRFNMAAIVSPTSQTTYYGTMYHNQGSAVAVNTSTLSAIRII